MRTAVRAFLGPSTSIRSDRPRQSSAEPEDCQIKRVELAHRPGTMSSSGGLLTISGSQGYRDKPLNSSRGYLALAHGLEAQSLASLRFAAWPCG